jgi:hypothetical protein
MAAVLWSSANAAEWRQHLTAYPDRITARNKDGLAELDRYKLLQCAVVAQMMRCSDCRFDDHAPCHRRSWYQALPQTVDARGKQPHITAEELVRIVSRWCHSALSVRRAGQMYENCLFVCLDSSLWLCRAG